MSNGKSIQNVGRPRGSVKGQGVAKSVTFPPETWASVENLAKGLKMKPQALVRHIVESFIGGNDDVFSKF